MSTQYWEEEIETMSREKLQELQLQRLKKTINIAANSPYYKEVFDLLLPKVKSETCMIIGQPYATAEKKLWWKEVVADKRTGVTFDLYDVGLVFFDKSRVKEHRIVNFL